LGESKSALMSFLHSSPFSGYKRFTHFSKGTDGLALSVGASVGLFLLKSSFGVSQEREWR
jgi:hypothetical protein